MNNKPAKTATLADRIFGVLAKVSISSGIGIIICLLLAAPEPAVRRYVS